jgi:alkanesulfonate monooxygenase SsuD/methylene tetrahydromethanopterin reductase-like flavin-dependent oxidoreductase (luciferase family)
VELYCAETRQRAYDEALPSIAARYRSYFQWGMDDNVPGESGASLAAEGLVRDRFVIGTPDDCIKGCLERRNFGVTHLIVRFNFPGMEQANILKAIRLFGREVIPALRARG